MVRYDMASVDAVASIELPCEVDANGRAGFLDFLQILLLLDAFEFILTGNEVNRYLFFLRLRFYYRFEQLHEIADLVKQPI